MYQRGLLIAVFKFEGYIQAYLTIVLKLYFDNPTLVGNTDCLNGPCKVLRWREELAPFATLITLTTYATLTIKTRN